MSSEPLCPFVQESRDQIIMIRTPFRSTDRTIKFQNSRPQLTLDHELDQIKFGPKCRTTIHNPVKLFGPVGPSIVLEFLKTGKKSEKKICI